MWIYNLIYGLTLVGILLSLLGNKKVIIIFYILTSVVITLSIALRGQYMGADTYSYLEYFLNPNQSGTYYHDIHEHVEPGFIAFNYLVGFFTSNKYVFLFFSAVIPYCALFYFGLKHSPYAMLFIFSVLSFSIGSSLYFTSFGAVRQTLALGAWAIFLHLYVKNYCRINIPALIALIVMVSMHSSSIIVLIPLLLERITLSKKIMLAICVASYFLAMCMQRFTPYLSLLSAVLNKEFYLSANEDSFEWNPLALLPYMGMFLLMLYYFSKEQCNNIFVKSYLLSIVSSAILYSIGNNLDRINMYFYVAAFIPISAVFSEMKSQKSKLLYPALLVFLAYFTYKYYVAFELVYINVGGIVPYESCFADPIP